MGFSANRSKFAVQAFAIVLLTISLVPVAAGDTEPLTGEVFNVTVEAASTSPLLTEPVVLNVRVRNVHTSVLRFVPSWDLMDHLRWQTYSKDMKSSEWTEWKPPTNVDRESPPDTIELDPGQTYNQRGIFVAYEEPGDRPAVVPVCNQPGPFLLKVVFVPYDPSAPDKYASVGKLESNVLTLTVSDPKGDNKAAQELWLQGFHEPRSGFGIVEHGIEHTNQSFAALLRDYPESPYAKYAAFFMARDEHIVLEADMPDKPLPQFYAEMLEPVVSDRDFPLRDAAMVRLAELYVRMRRPLEAVQLLDEIIAEMPESPFIEEARKAREGVATILENPDPAPAAGVSE